MQEILAYIRGISDALQPYRGLIDTVFLIAWIGFVILLFGSAAISLFQYIHRKVRKIPHWALTKWQQDTLGNWETQPALIIDGVKYTFDTPREYIPLFEDLMRRTGDPTGYLENNIKSFRTAVEYRAIQRANNGLAPDSPTNYHQPNKPSPFIPVQLPLEESALPQTPQLFSNSGPIKGMALKRKRYQRKGSFGKTIFTLDARIEMSAENRALVERYKLGNHIVYESANREKYAARAREHADNTSDQPGIFASPGAQAWGLAKTFGRIGAAAINATASALSLRITVNSLIEGVHVECKSMEEILEAEEAIKDAALNLKAYLETSTTFSGQEEIIEL